MRSLSPILTRCRRPIVIKTKCRNLYSTRRVSLSTASPGISSDKEKTSSLREENDTVTGHFKISRIQSADKLVRVGLRKNSRLPKQKPFWTPKGFVRQIYLKITKYLSNPSEENDRDLLSAWKEFLWQWSGVQERLQLPDLTALDWSFLPQVEGALFYNQNEDGKMSAYGPWRIRRAMPLLTTSSPDIFTALTGTFCALIMTNPARFRVSNDTPFLYFAASMLYRASTNMTADHLKMELGDVATNANTSRYLTAVDCVQAHATIIVSGHRLFYESLQEEDLNKELVAAVVDKHVGMLERLTIGFQSYKLDAIWISATRTFHILRHHWIPSNIHSDLEWKHMPSRLYLSFMRVGYVLDRPQFSMDAWNAMIESGIQPTIEHVTTAIKGAGDIKDARQVDRLWSMILKSDIPTDDQFWTARIGATLQSGEFRKGLALLQQIGEESKNHALQAASTQESRSGPKPTVVTLNVALSAISSTRGADIHLIQSLLNWAASLNIQPNRITCNILISVFTSIGQVIPAIDILYQMTSHGLAPDVLTITSLLNGTIKSEKDYTLSVEERTRIVFGIIEVMEGADIKPNDYILAALVKGALHGSLEPTLASKILDYARSSGERIYGRLATALLDHFFKSEQPDLESVHALWKEINNANLQADSFFFNRMVQGFASAGELKYMTFFLDRMVKNGMSPTWNTLVSALSVSTQQESRYVGEAVVAEARTALSKGTLSSQGPDPQEQLFWNIANTFGLE